VLDLYTNGNYEFSAAGSAGLLLEHPTLYELYYIYLHSQGYQGQLFKQIFPAGSPAARLLEHLDAVTREDRGWRANIDAILKTAMSLWRDPLAYGLFDFYVQETQLTPDSEVHKLALLNATYMNPYFMRIFDDVAQAEAFLDQFSAFAPNSSTVTLLKRLTTTSHYAEEVELPVSLPEARRLIYRAAIHEARKRPHLAISDLKPLLERIENGNLEGAYLVRDRIHRTLFRCYLQTKELGECMGMVVKNFLRNPGWIRKLPLGELVNAIDHLHPPDVMQKITYPLLSLSHKTTTYLRCL
jgi:hypothetical protein